MARTKQTARISDSKKPPRKQLAVPAMRKMPETQTGENEAYVYFSRWIMDMENGSSLVHVPYPTPTIGFVFSKDVPDYLRHVTPRALTRKQWDDFVGTGGQPKEPVYIDTSGSQQKLSSINIKIVT